MTIEDVITVYPNMQRAAAVIVVALANAQGRVIGKQHLRDELEAVLGNEATEESMTSAVKRARAEIGYGAIKTVKGVGYRWAGEVPQW